MLTCERPAEEPRAIDGAMARLRKAIAKLPDEEIADDFRVASLSTAADLDHLRRLRAAFRARRKVRLSYRKADAEEASTRVICPYGIVFAGGMWYAVGHCEGSEGMRIFRLARVEQVAPLEARVQAPRGFSLDSILQGGKALHAPRARLRRYSPRIAR
jgi:predicted DNA-binding transcriptional regulator YafY